MRGFRKFLIFYLTAAQNVDIVRVLRAESDWWTLLGVAEDHTDDENEDGGEPDADLLAQLQQDIRDGMASGDACPLHVDDIKRRGCERLAALQTKE